MPYEQMIEFYDLKDRLAYYASDLKAVCDALDEHRRGTTKDREIDDRLRVFLLALESITNSLTKESENL